GGRAPRVAHGRGPVRHVAPLPRRRPRPHAVGGGGAPDTHVQVGGRLRALGRGARRAVPLGPVAEAPPHHGRVYDGGPQRLAGLVGGVGRVVRRALARAGPAPVRGLRGGARARRGG